VLTATKQFEADMKALTKALCNDLKSELDSQYSTFSDSCEKIIDKYDRSLLRPKDSEIYHAVYLYLKGRIGEDLEYLYDLVSYGLYLPIEVLDNKYIAQDKEKLAILLNRYSYDAYSGNLQRETWLAVLRAYFQSPDRREEHSLMLNFLSETFTKMYNLTDHKPSWLQYLHDNPEILSADPCRSMGKSWFEGNRDYINSLVKSLQIPHNSWFWQSMVSSCIYYVSYMPDDEFVRYINDISIMLDDTPSYVDEGLLLLMRRYSQCEDTTVNDDLKNLSFSLWKNPRFRLCGISHWMNVDTEVWNMAMSWINEDYMKLFFDRISERHEDRKARLAMWLKYVEWSRFVTNLEENFRLQKDQELLQMFMMEEEAVYNLDEMRNEKLDIFINRISGYLEKAKV